MSERENSCFIPNDGADPTASISNVRIQNVGSVGFTSRVSVSTVTKSLCVFSDKIFTTWCAPFPNRIFHCKVLAMP